MDNPARANCVLLWLLLAVSGFLIIVGMDIYRHRPTNPGAAMILAGLLSSWSPLVYMSLLQDRIQLYISRQYYHTSPRLSHDSRDIVITIKSEDKPNQTRRVHLTAELRHHLMTLYANCPDFDRVSHTNSGIGKREDYRDVIGWLEHNKLGSRKGRNQGARVTTEGRQVLEGMAQRLKTRRMI